MFHYLLDKVEPKTSSQGLLITFTKISSFCLPILKCKLAEEQHLFTAVFLAPRIVAGTKKV